MKPAAASMSSLFCIWLAQADTAAHREKNTNTDLIRSIVFSFILWSRSRSCWSQAGRQLANPWGSEQSPMETIAYVLQ